MKQAIVILFMAVFTTGLLYGQRGAASVSGTVTDPTGAVVANAAITLDLISTGQVSKATTDENGFYVVPNLAPGTYRLRCEMAGFQNYEDTQFELQQGQVATANVVLQVGSQTETVTVTDTATLVDVRTQTLGRAITPAFARALPLNGRNALQLILISPEVSPATTSLYAQTATRPESRSTFASASGGRSNGTAFYLDGATNEDPYTNVANVFPNPDAIQEFHYETNNSSAKYQGRGGGVVSAVTRGGTNELHGTAFEFLRNNALNARNFFAKTDDGQKRNQYGFSLGGPVKRDKTFFFVSWQGTQLRQRPATNNTITPTAAMLSGDFHRSTSNW